MDRRIVGKSECYQYDLVEYVVGVVADWKAQEANSDVSRVFGTHLCAISHAGTPERPLLFWSLFWLSSAVFCRNFGSPDWDLRDCDFLQNTYRQPDRGCELA